MSKEWICLFCGYYHYKSEMSTFSWNCIIRECYRCNRTGFYMYENNKLISMKPIDKKISDHLHKPYNFFLNTNHS